MAESSSGTPSLYKGLPERRERPAAKGGLDKLYLRAGRHRDGYRAAGLFAAQGGGEDEDAVSWLTNRADDHRAVAELEIVDQENYLYAIAARRIEDQEPRSETIYIPAALTPRSVHWYPDQTARYLEIITYVWGTNNLVAKAACAELIHHNIMHNENPESWGKELS